MALFCIRWAVLASVGFFLQVPPSDFEPPPPIKNLEKKPCPLNVFVQETSLFLILAFLNQKRNSVINETTLLISMEGVQMELVPNEGFHLRNYLIKFSVCFKGLSSGINC